MTYRFTSAVKYLAHIEGDREQSVESHLAEVGQLAEDFAAKIGSPSVGLVLGLLHDFGKYSFEFQGYILSATELLDQDDEEWVDVILKKGKIDHSTAGAQYVWSKLRKIGARHGQGELCGQIVALCIASHHSGLVDCLNAEGEDSFKKRMGKCDDKTHLEEVIRNADVNIKNQVDDLLSEQFVKSLFTQIRSVVSLPKNSQASLSNIDAFMLGMFTRFLFSCLIDADRLNSAEFAMPERKEQRQLKAKNFSWDNAINRLEDELASYPLDSSINRIRHDISQQCYQRARDKQGIYTLTVPTGGGKTLASLRYALHHAKQHQLDRIIYIIPYTSIIEQNADAVRKIMEQEGDMFEWVLEHHSNIDPDQQTWHSKLAAENWDTPIVFTTMVQLLDSLFASGTRGARRMHQLANAVLVFDEIQTLPIKCVHMFCNALNFLSQQANTTAVLCTATQPLLDKLPKSQHGELGLADEPELIADKRQLFDHLKRVSINNRCRPGGWEQSDIVDWIQQRFNEQQSCLVIVNTKQWAKKLYVACAQHVDTSALFHLSTHQCAKHRKALLKKIHGRLDEHQPVLCISTQLIEAGVDISFANVIRFLAGLDSIAQAAGRCNRNAELVDGHGQAMSGQVDVINPASENIDSLFDIKEGQRQTQRVFREFDEDALLSPDALEAYFKYYFFERQQDMVYPKNGDCLFDMLSNNNNNAGASNNQTRNKAGKVPLLQQSFMQASKAFQAIDAPTHSVIVPYGEGEELIKQLCGANTEFNSRVFYALLKKAQQYSVNVFPGEWRKLQEAGAVQEIQEEEGIYYLDERFYSEEFGL